MDDEPVAQSYNPEPKAADEVGFVEFWGTFFREVDWTEPFLVALISFHILSALTIIFTKNRPNLQMILFLFLAGIGYAAEQLNELAAQHWEKFSKEQYFDSGGFFVATVLCFPILLNLSFLTIVWLTSAASLMVTVKRAELRAKKKKKKDE